MKLTAKNLPVFMRVTILSMIVGTLAWELVERLVELAGGVLDLGVGPIGFDAEVLAVWIEVNPGTLLGIVPAIVLLRRL